VRRVAALFLACLVALGVGAPAVAAAQSTAKVPKVVVIVGPAGAATNRYRAEARSAAALARRYTPDVTELYSPDATWPAVKAALQGASLVIYMGHGNGWPSRYRDALYPPTQNGFGLNPSAGSGDNSHQYFGEGPIAASVRLAPNAVVLLNHLCYASGNSEPGLPEGTLEMARQRVDNFAAGFIRAGASAVIAEAYTSPNYMVRTVLGTKRSIDAAWRNAPTKNGHAFAFESKRSAGYVAQMDPERGTSGFSRSIVLKVGLASADVLRGARGSATVAAGPLLPTVPSLVASGMQLKVPTIAGATLAASKLKLKLPYAIADRDQLPKTIKASVRWDPLDPVAASDPANEVATGEPGSTPAGSGAGASAAASSGPAATSAPATSDAPAASSAPATDAGAAAATQIGPPKPPSLDLVVPEVLGDVVAPAKVKISKKSMGLSVAAPTTPGRYRLTIVLHDKDGVAYDAATQAMLPALIVRITGDLDAQIVAPTSTDLAPGASSTLSLWAANLGKTPWGHPAIHDAKDPDATAPAAAARVTGQWVALGGDDAQVAAAAAASVTAASLPAGLEPGVVVPADLGLFAPTVEGDYLLVLDILTPERGSIVAAGVAPTTIRVHVAQPVVVEATPAPTTTAAPETTTKPSGRATKPAPASSTTD
jgi:hypothetical protein